MSFSALSDRLPRLASSGVLCADWPRIGRGGASFSDDLALGNGKRLGVRVRITDREGGGYCIDLRDSDPTDPTGRFGLDRGQTETACMLAIGRALGEAAHQGFVDRVELLTDSNTWVEGEHAADPAAIAFGMARTFDAVLGALANAWPGRVGAGSSSLGAVVELRAGPEILLTEVLPGGEGGQPDRPGVSAWSGPILPSEWPTIPEVDGVTIEEELRENSGGGGKQPGGNGVIRRYLVQRPLFARLAFDRVHNPPHGIDRAGPPLGTAVELKLPGTQQPTPVLPWLDTELPPGSRLTVQTCGGAGWGFPGYGEIEWDPSEWFGSKAKSS